MREDLAGLLKKIQKTMIYSKTDLNGVILELSSAFCKISGYSKKELIGKKHSILKHPDMQDSNFAKLWKSIKEKRPYRILFKNIAKNGKIFYLDSLIIPIFNEKNEVCAYASFAYDLSKFFSLNEELMESKKKIEQMNEHFEQMMLYYQKNLYEKKMSIKEELSSNFKNSEESLKKIQKESLDLSIKEVLSNLAHQWRQPLSELGLLLFKMKQDLKDEQKFEENYEECKKTLKKMSAHIDEFISSSRSFQRSFSLMEALQEAQNISFERLQNQGVQIHLSSKKDYKILGDEKDLVRVFFNLFMNSVDAYGKKKHKDIFVSLSEFGKNYVKITVRDRAGGILFLDKVFQPFWTTKYPVQGAGLDLFFSKQLIENMQGQIKVSNDKKGACFNIYLRQDKEETK
ncbi:PAS domain-containing sensor histidine kinase [Campylobacter troglodytis]|uniref:PAS domain-containing sensor histidine kinase n=1 Tax=Campylobacter troglodytis TaxID=654363 RepID=UPI00115A1C13|nr:PAS domain-containing sensor histidine kinase [Campylobacter troglodytis]TQR60792.1 ATPase [Campylobacter troglodytis]